MQLLTAPVALDVDVIDLHILRLQLIDDRADIIHRVKLQIQIDVARVFLNVCIHDWEQADAQKDHSKRELTNGYKIRRAAIDHNIPLITNARLASAFIEAFCTMDVKDIQIKDWQDYK